MDPIARQVVPIRIEDEMRNSYLDYSMSVIIGRALPDVRDGLKPVHRRILYAMHQMGMSSGKRYTKCAGVVGEVLKKFHPHGDSAVYDALARMAQPWNLRYMMVDGQGNFGSVDGDPPAAYRYTECRMTRIAEEMLVDIKQQTVDFVPNFDGTEDEPTVLPSRIPNLLVNGADGIAVGMATKIPPHNLDEIVEACIALIDQPELSLAELMAIVPGPDFPTAGTIYGRRGIRDAYETGRGRVIVRGNASFEEREGGGVSLVIDELPFQVNKARLLEQIAHLVRDKRLEGIRALRDESDREGMRIVLELKRDAFGEVVLNHLYKHTALQSTFGVILLAIVDSQPRVLSLREMLSLFLAHRREVILRRTRYQLIKARERAHLLEGFRRALDVLDELITLIRQSPTPAEARERMIERFEFSEGQATAILEMRLQRLTGMERKRVLDELEEVHARIAELEAVLASESVLMGLVRAELEEVQERYGDRRRTRIVDSRGELSMHDLVAKEDQVVTVSYLGYIKRCSPDEWRAQRRGGFGIKGMATREEDFVTSLFVANTHSLLMVFTNRGHVFPLPVYEVPESGRGARGRPIINLVPVPRNERVAVVVSVGDLEDPGSLVYVSRAGLVKRTPISAFKNLRQGGMIAAGVSEEDDLVVVKYLPADAQADVMLFSESGKCIRFDLEDVPEFGRTARGNRGMQLDGEDTVVDAQLVPPLGSEEELELAEEAAEGAEEPPAPSASETAAPRDEPGEAEDEVQADADAEEGAAVDEPYASTLLTVTSDGYGKRTPFSRYPKQRRNGKGVISVGSDDRIGTVVAAVEVYPEDELLLATDTGRMIRFSAGEVRLVTTRNSIGVRLMRVEEDEHIVDVARIPADDEEEDASAEASDDADESGADRAGEPGSEETDAEAEAARSGARAEHDPEDVGLLDELVDRATQDARDAQDGAEDESD